MGPVVDGRKGTHQKLLARLIKDGYTRVRVDGEVYLLSDDIPLDKNKKHTIDVIVDRLVIKDSILMRLTDSLETAAKLADGIVHIFRMGTKEVLTFSQHFACPDCHISLPEIEPISFPSTVLRRLPGPAQASAVRWKSISTWSCRTRRKPLPTGPLPPSAATPTRVHAPARRLVEALWLYLRQ